MNRCSHDGWVVDSRPLPVDPVDHDDGDLPRLGCTRIRCSRCNDRVRSAPGIMPASAAQQLDLAALYGLSDLASSPLFVASKSHRFYLCRCSSYAESSEHPLDEKDYDWSIKIDSWACEGHPLATLPHEFDGITITDANLAELVGRALHGWVPPGALAQDRPKAWWLARLHVRFAQTPHANAVVKAVLAGLDDADAGARGRALQFFRHREKDVGAERAQALLEGDRRGFSGVRDEFTDLETDATLEDSLWRVAIPRVAYGPARDLARREVLTSGKGSRAVYDGLTIGDAAWVAEHVDEITSAAPARVKDLFGAGQHRLPKPVVAKLKALIER